MSAWNRDYEKYKEIFRLREIEKFSTIQISEIVGVSPGSVDRILRKYKKHIVNAEI